MFGIKVKFTYTHISSLLTMYCHCKTGYTDTCRHLWYVK